MHSLAPSISNILGVVVLFEPEGDLKARLRRVQTQVAWLVIVSNDSCGTDRLAGLNSDRITHLQAQGNIGLAAALNLGLKEAQKRGYAWCLLLDQDTVVDRDLVAGLSTVYRSAPHPEKIALLAPNYRSLAGARTAYATNVLWQTLETAITSGSLVFTEIALQTGGMREEFFIEGIDIEFSLRLRSAGFSIVASGQPLMTHGAGASEERKIFGRTVLVGHHPPWRCFLQFRNLTWILWRYRKQEPVWARYTFRSILKRLCIVILYEQQRMQKLLAMLRGTFVGLAKAWRSDVDPVKGSLPRQKEGRE